MDSGIYVVLSLKALLQHVLYILLKIAGLMRLDPPTFNKHTYIKGLIYEFKD